MLLLFKKCFSFGPPSIRSWFCIFMLMKCQELWLQERYIREGCFWRVYRYGEGKEKREEEQSLGVGVGLWVSRFRVVLMLQSNLRANVILASSCFFVLSTTSFILRPKQKKNKKRKYIFCLSKLLFCRWDSGRTRSDVIYSTRKKKKRVCQRQTWGFAQTA